MQHIIFDELTGIPTVLAANRAKRPDQTGVVDKTEKEKPKEKVDFFAKGNESMTPPTVYQDKDDWSIRVFANKFPILDNHEIIVHSPSAEVDLADLPTDQVVRYVRAILNRVEFYTNDDKEVFIFNNRGGTAGASLDHPHTQLVALRGFPGIIETQKEEALHYFNEKGTCYWCDQAKEELDERSRVVYESPHFVAYVPVASRWSYELVLAPKRHLPNIAFIDETEINDLAKTLQAILGAYDALFDKPDRNFWIYTQRYESFHWHMGFMPHLAVLGGLEMGAGIWVSSKATPEDAAYQLSEAVKKELQESH
ncbi:DUF4931 domain-containing protein [Patescibacteria group bacterium]